MAFPLITSVGNRDIPVLSVLTPRLKYPELVRGLVGAWSPCFGNTGLILPDYAGRKNSGTLTNGPTWTTNNGRSALSFDGTDDHVNIPHAPAINFQVTDKFSLSVWMRREATTDFVPLMSKYTSDFKGFFVAGVNGASTTPYVQLQQSPTEYIYRVGTTLLDDGALHLLAMTYDGSNAATGIRIYVDGREEVYTDTAASGTITDIQNTDSLYLGRRFNFPSDYHFAGQLLDCLAYTRVLSASEEQFKYSLGPGGWAEKQPYRFYSFPPPQTSSSSSSPSSISSISSISSLSSSTSSSVSSLSSLSSSSSVSSTSSSSSSSESSLSSTSSISSISFSSESSQSSSSSSSLSSLSSTSSSVSSSSSSSSSLSSTSSSVSSSSSSTSSSSSSSLSSLSSSSSSSASSLSSTSSSLSSSSSSVSSLSSTSSSLSSSSSSSLSSTSSSSSSLSSSSTSSSSTSSSAESSSSVLIGRHLTGDLSWEPLLGGILLVN